MISAHDAHTTHILGPGTVVPLLLIAAVAAVYLVLALQRRREPRGWSIWRTTSFLTGIALLVLAVTPALSPYPVGDFRGHMHQHLLLGMYAPLGLVLGAPITLILRSISPAHGRLIGRVLRSRAAHFLAHPIVALILSVGGLAALYFTPLYAATTTNEALHLLVHAHFLLASYLFAWVIAGPDPAPHRPSVPVRLVVLGVAIAGHAVISQLMYAGLFVQIPVPPNQRQGAGELMYYGGDIAELLLALALLLTWRPDRHHPAPNGPDLHTHRSDMTVPTDPRHRRQSRPLSADIHRTRTSSTRG
ncbi:putative membrane protein [Rhodococcus percolatus]|uniref:cytochrome c oxidase assembly protein n=1 Tax=Rhodococcus opacus TaxID=37919 RepID=UPI0015FE2144|nr:cytochrome c oxidase assembly protein [Rhodococcus opacus]MBA8962414.1 putative membrane protein [Rhodococcus opacus]MBP2209057.1 putative membrane protein [Rhodococcus opacus]